MIVPKIPPKRTKEKARKRTGEGLERRLRALELGLAKLCPVPDEWLLEGNGASKNGQNGKAGELAPIVCTEYKVLINAWRAALKWTPGLDHALAMMLASVVSTKTVGDQLWLKIIGPASSGKSTLCEALTVARKYVISKDTFKGLSSGYQTNDEGSENLSLVMQMRDKTLIINDGDTLLQLPNLPEVISQLRAFYGRNLRTSFKNKMSADHEGYNTTVLLCGTSSLRKLDESELGERFLDCVIMEKIDEELEDEILLRVAYRSARNLCMEASADATKQDDPALVHAKQLTGGYVEYLRENAIDLISSVNQSKEAILECTYLGKFVAFMRARPSTKQSDSIEREFAPRLVSQLTRAVGCLPVVLGKKETDKAVLQRVRKVALDTGRGVTFDIASLLYEADNGLEAKGLAINLNKSTHQIGSLLLFMSGLEMVEQFSFKKKRGWAAKTRWRLTSKLRKLYGRVVDATNS